VKRAIKGLLGRSLFGAGLSAVLLRNTAVVVAFHRVQDGEAADGLTVGVGIFEQYCRFFGRHFNVVPLQELVERLEEGRPLNRELAITFDDGYRDNFENAAPVLEKLGLPATFFVVTQWIDTDIVPWWDTLTGVRHPWMTWAEVESLHRRGFEIGAHTRTHADLGAVGAAEACEEICGARRELECRLGTPVASFAYPYGGRRHLADSSREVVKAAGFRCCCSGFGGLNTRGTDPFRLRRVPVSNWYASPHQFGLEVAFRRTLASSSAEPSAAPGWSDVQRRDR
jgi:peptidoglycan/xylan/chitin deacetylase (PgdA/CDA1 family)